MTLDGKTLSNNKCQMKSVKVIHYYKSWPNATYLTLLTSTKYQAYTLSNFITLITDFPDWIVLSDVTKCLPGYTN